MKSSYWHSCGPPKEKHYTFFKVDKPVISFSDMYFKKQIGVCSKICVHHNVISTSKGKGRNLMA